MKITSQTITPEMRVAALEAAVETLLLEREMNEQRDGDLDELDTRIHALENHPLLSMNAKFQEKQELAARLTALETEAAQRAEMVRIAEEKKREAYQWEQAIAYATAEETKRKEAVKAQDYAAKLAYAQQANWLQQYKAYKA